MLVPPSDMYWVMTERQVNHAERTKLYDRWRHETFRLWAHHDTIACDGILPLTEYLESMSESPRDEL